MEVRRQEQAAPSPKKKRKLSVHDVYSPYVTDIILSKEKKDQFLTIERELAKTIDHLLPLREEDLPTIIHDFYAMAASTSVITSDVLYRNTIINIVYTSTPLITYIHRFFGRKKSCVQRDNLILYALTRLIERLILLTNPFDPEESQPVAMIIRQNPPLSHPFPSHHDDQLRYKGKIRERYGLDLADILMQFGGNPDQFLLHIILLTCLTSLDYVRHESCPSNVEDSWFWTIKNLVANTEEGDWKMFMGSAKYGLGVDRDARLVRLQTYHPDSYLPFEPVNNIGYNYDAYIHRLGESVQYSIHGEITKALYLDTAACNSALVRYPLKVRYPHKALRQIQDGFRTMRIMKKQIDEAYAAFTSADFVDKDLETEFRQGGTKLYTSKKADRIIVRHEILADLSHYINMVYSVRGMLFMSVKSDVAFSVILEKRVSDFVFGILTSGHIEFDFPAARRIYQLLPEKMDNQLLALGVSGKYTFFEYMGRCSLLVGLRKNDRIDESYWSLCGLEKKTKGGMILRMMVLLSLDLNVSPGSFIINKSKRDVAYAPILSENDNFYNFSNICLGQYHRALLGDVHDVNETGETLLKINDMKYMWREVAPSDQYIGIGSDFDTAIICRCVLGLIKANTHMLYSVIRYNQYRFGRSAKPLMGCMNKVNWRCNEEIEMYQKFVSRVEGLYDASVDLYNKFWNK